jgi:hypothetical protein
VKPEVSRFGDDPGGIAVLGGHDRFSGLFADLLEDRVGRAGEQSCNVRALGIALTPGGNHLRQALEHRVMRRFGGHR